MKFDMEFLKEAVRASRDSWDKGHYLTYSDRRCEVMEHRNGTVKVWYWITPEEFEVACEDLNALDWKYE